MAIKSNPQIVAAVTWVKKNMTLLVLGGLALYVILRVCGIDVFANLEKLAEQEGVGELLALFGITGGWAAVKLLVKSTVKKEVIGLTNDIDEIWTEIEKAPTAPPATPTTPAGSTPPADVT